MLEIIGYCVCAIGYSVCASVVFIISMLFAGILYCFNYTSLLLHLIITQLLIDFIITM